VFARLTTQLVKATALGRAEDLAMRSSSAFALNQYNEKSFRFLISRLTHCLSSFRGLSKLDAILRTLSTLQFYFRGGCVFPRQKRARSSSPASSVLYVYCVGILNLTSGDFGTLTYLNANSTQIREFLASKSHRWVVS